MRQRNRILLLQIGNFGILIAILTMILRFIFFRKFDQLHNLVADKEHDLTDRIDWQDWAAIIEDCRRTGLGENGEPATLGNKIDRALVNELFKQHGLNALLSDAISVNRSVRDTRDKACLHKKYLAKLPSVSIVIPFHNELFSTFARTLHSIINRTPPELLQEIILVDDFSDIEFFAKLEQYVVQNFKEKIKFVRLPERSGLIQARLAGARRITAEIMVVLDAHIEVNHNWLPPLLEPIALNRNTVVCPHIDRINSGNLNYHDIGLTYGVFSWSFTYYEKYHFPEHFANATAPYKNPLMMGGLFAISIDFFWHLGGYDEGLQIWGGEEYELSFKIWMCGGQLLTAPCSRVGHHFRGNLDKGMNAKIKNFKHHNLKRVTDVWLDEYGKYVYERSIIELDKIDAGDLTVQKALRKKLQCKPFKWYLNEVSVETLKEFPLIESVEYASGTIQSVASPNKCIDSFGSSLPGLYSCYRNQKMPTYTQSFVLRFGHDIHLRHTSMCLDVPNYSVNAQVILFPCHEKGGTQFWYYDRRKKWLVHGRKGQFCLESSPSNRKLFINICRGDNVNMKWNFANVNETALDSFLENIRN